LKRDPFYREIWDGLGRDLDPDLFERCVGDLLRQDFPTLVPVRGGGDSGMDGAIADGEGPAFPLVCTTSGDVIGNLTKSLRSYLKDGGTRRKVVSATSQELTPRRRQNLVRRAADLGFELIQVYDRAALTDRLYGHPKWCLELLNLTGDAPVLSTEPLSSRLVTDAELIGRDADRAWLSETSGDRLLVGHPGSGKTSLLHGLAREGRGLFLVGEDLAKAAPEIRSKRPDVVIVDDAHVDPDRLARLVQLRRELSATFSILASVWPGDYASVAEVLGLPSSQIRVLELLTKDQIVQVIRSCGLVGPTALIREIVEQARGRPGLAVTLASLCCREGTREVALGTALKRSVHSFLEKLVGERAIEILAAFAIGGDSGASWLGVAKAFGLSKIDVRRTIAGLEASGVVTDIDAEYMAVQPATLRHALVRDLFFSGPARLDTQPLMEVARHPRGVAETLVGVRAVGGQVPPALLWELLENADSTSAWVHYAWLGREEATRVLEEKPELITEVAYAGLYRAPDAVIDRLLDASVGDTRNLDSHTEHQLRQVRDWIMEARPGTGDGLERRALLLRSSAAWLARGGDELTGLSAIGIGLTPQCRWSESDPGSGRNVTLSFGYLAPEEILELGELWGGWIGSSPVLGEAGWKPILDLLREWVYPDPRLRLEGRQNDEIRGALRQVAGRMIRDVASLAGNRPGLQHLLASYAEEIGLPRPSGVDTNYEVLFPGREDLRGDWEEGQARQQAAALRLAEDWALREPSWVARRISELAREAISVRNTWPDHSATVCRYIAGRTDRPLAWIKAMEEADAFGVHVEPFLPATVARDDADWPAIAASFLERPSWMGVAVELVLTHPDPPAELLERVMDGLDQRNADFVETLVLRGQVPEGTLRRLLRHKDPVFASSAAVGEWLADPKGTVREALRADWRAAVLGDCSGRREEYWLGEIMGSDPELASRWMEAHLPEEANVFLRQDDLVSVATAALDTSGRLRLLSRLHESHWDGWLISRLVGDDMEVYRAFVADPRWKKRHLDPLTWPSSGSRFEEGPGLSEVWIEKARLAMASGYSAEDVALARLTSPKSWRGHESLMWQSWVEAFQALESHEDPLIRVVGRVAIDLAVRSRDRARQRERDEEVFGR
jgi:hypothetical protein